MPSAFLVLSILYYKSTYKRSEDALPGIIYKIRETCISAVTVKKSVPWFRSSLKRATSHRKLFRLMRRDGVPHERACSPANDRRCLPASGFICAPYNIIPVPNIPCKTDSLERSLATNRRTGCERRQKRTVYAFGTASSFNDKQFPSWSFKK